MLLALVVLAAILVGLLRGGRLDNLASVRLRGWYLLLVALAVQLVIFSPPAKAVPAIATLGPALYLVSFLLLFVALALNLSRFGRGLRIVGAGALLNVAAIVANGGYMPVSHAAMVLARGADAASALAATYSNTAYLAAPALAAFADWIPVPLPPPLAGNVISVGDLLISLGIFVLVTGGLLGHYCPAAPPAPSAVHTI